MGPGVGATDPEGGPPTRGLGSNPGRQDAPGLAVVESPLPFARPVRSSAEATKAGTASADPRMNHLPLGWNSFSETR
jgi:hypothetical protein